MRFGVNGSLKKAEVAMRLGYDFAEIPVSRLRAEGEEAIDTLERVFREHRFSAEVFNGFYPPEIAMYDGGEDAIRYAEGNVELARRLGAKTLVIGSGKARFVPEGMDKAAAFRAFQEIVGSIGEMAAPFGINVAVEPLNYKETNFINTLEDGMALSRAIALPNVGCMVDFFHFSQNGERFETFDRLEPGELIHVHVARPDETRGALRKEDREAVLKWKEVLERIGYDGRVTLEAKYGPDLETEFSESLKVLRLLRKAE